VTLVEEVTRRLGEQHHASAKNEGPSELDGNRCLRHLSK
jgi:hypothetical protein